MQVSTCRRADVSMCRRVKCIKPHRGDTPTNKQAKHQTKAPEGRHNGLYRSVKFIQVLIHEVGSQLLIGHS